MEHGRLDSILGSYSTPWTDFCPITRPNMPVKDPVTTDEESNTDVVIKYLKHGQLQKGLGVGGVAPSRLTATFFELCPNWIVFQCKNNYLMH